MQITSLKINRQLIYPIESKSIKLELEIDEWLNQLRLTNQKSTLELIYERQIVMKISTTAQSMPASLLLLLRYFSFKSEAPTHNLSVQMRGEAVLGLGPEAAWELLVVLTWIQMSMLHRGEC